MPVPRNKAVIGGNAYRRESGIHQDGVLKNPETYEIITPQLVGVEHNSLPLGKLLTMHLCGSDCANGLLNRRSR